MTDIREDLSTTNPLEGNMTMRRMLRVLATLLALSMLAAACGGSDDSESAGGGDAAAGCEAGQTDGDLAIFNWTEYMDPELKTAFEEEFGVSVTEASSSSAK